MRRHGGRFFHNDFRIEQNVQLLVPPKDDLKPSMVISFELFLLSAVDAAQDKVVGHGFFPLIDADFNMIRGMFKVPIVKGKVDISIDKFQDLEQSYRKDLDQWLCNFYFSVEQIEDIYARISKLKEI